MRFFTTVHILLLAYIIAALVFWGTSLYSKSEEIYAGDIKTLKSEVDSALYPEMYNSKVKEYKSKLDMSKKQYLGEGATFLLIILVGAAVVYTSFRRSVMLSRQQNNFMLSVTHELKSPIAAMKLNLQTLERHQLEEEKKKKLIDRCIVEANRLNELCNNMLIASQMEGKQYVPAKEEISLYDLVKQILSDYSARHPNRISIGEMVECNIVGDRLLLQLAINNLIENAIKYTPEDKGITVSLVAINNHFAIKIIDQGAGISDSEKHKVFNKFYRIGNEATRKTKGTGLGLYLANKIVKQHNGNILLYDNVPTGSVFELHLPVS